MTLLDRNLTFCLLPIFMVPILKDEASNNSLDELPIKASNRDKQE